ncbi:MAG TPA: T9SS type A sorting domain-containing protein [Bacteroidales bacterium]|nr:T9SS type A sorting domain-containing protein [Bacteroidales bacterium]
MRKIFLLFILSFFISLCLKGQIGVGEWRDHLPFTFTFNICESPSRIFVASEQGLMTYNKQNQQIQKYTKVNGLSDVGISAIAYSVNDDLLLTGYSNGNIDILKNNQVINFSAIKRANIIGSKKINHIMFVDGFAYLSCGFGIVVLNLEKLEVKDTYFIGEYGEQLQVNQLVFDNNYFYAATQEGIFTADYTNPNLADYASWTQIVDIPDYTANFNAIYVKNGVILANKVNESSKDITYLFNNVSWTVFNQDYNSIKKIKHGNNQVQMVTTGSILVYDNDLNFQDSITKDDIERLNPNDVIVDNDNTFWIADQGDGLIRYDQGNYEMIYINAPYTSNSYAVDILNNRVLVAGGGISPSGNNVFLNGSIFSFQNEQWKSIMNYEAHDYVSVKIDPYNTEHYFVGSWGKGLIEYRNDEIIKEHNESNSSLQSIIPGDNFIRIPGMAWDKKNNLWVANTGVTNPVSVKTANGEWYSFNFDSEISNIQIKDIIVTENEHKWIILPGNGLFVFDDNRTPDNENDDLYKKFSIVDENGIIITNNILSIAEDLDGDIWLGTDQGIVVYYNPADVFESSLFYGHRIVLTIGDYTQYLLNTETITSIAVDGANKKWIGTQNAGVYLVSKDGTEEINHFTAENSPLLSNRINDVGINHETGEVFMATDKGLVSYRGSATMGSDEFRDVYVYPNPVREDYHGDITIRGLVSNVNVKITDISGNIVYETNAEGGQATWNGKNFSGKRVSTGVYLVFCSNDDGSKTHITKLLFIR